MVYDVTQPAGAFFVTYVNNRDFSVSVEDAEDIDLRGAAGSVGRSRPPVLKGYVCHCLTSDQLGLGPRRWCRRRVYRAPAASRADCSDCA